MFGISLGEFAVVLLLSAILIRPKDMPELAAWLARMWARVRGRLAEINRQISEAAGDIGAGEGPREVRESLFDQIEHIKREMGKPPRLYDEIEDKKTPKLDIEPAKKGKK